MESPNRRYLPAVDHLRAFAALLIVVYHSFHLFYPRMVLHRGWQGTDWIHTRKFLLAPLIEGHTAVSMFLVISGFILTYGSLGRTVVYKGFFWNRFLRLFPLFFFILITGANAFRPQFQFGSFLTWALQFGYLAGGTPYGVWTGVAWSISVEAHLYCLFPVIHSFLNSHRLWALFRILLILWIVRLGAIGLGADVVELTYSTALGRVDQFVAGALLAWLLHRYGLPKWIAFLFPVTVAAVCTSLYGFHLSGGYLAYQRWRILWPDLEAVLWAAFAACYLGFARYLPHFIDVGLQFLGRISYSLYLVHLMVIWIFAEKGWYFSFSALSVDQNILLSAFLIVLPVVVSISTLTYAAIEEPFLSMRWRYHTVNERATGALPASSNSQCYPSHLSKP